MPRQRQESRSKQALTNLNYIMLSPVLLCQYFRAGKKGAGGIPPRGADQRVGAPSGSGLLPFCAQRQRVPPGLRDLTEREPRQAGKLISCGLKQRTRVEEVCASRVFCSGGWARPRRPPAGSSALALLQGVEGKIFGSGVLDLPKRHLTRMVGLPCMLFSDRTTE